MTRRTVPARVETMCDRCQQEIKGPENRLIVSQVGRDYQGHAVGGSNGEYDFCDSCMHVVISSLKAALSGHQGDKFK